MFIVYFDYFHFGEDFYKQSLPEGCQDEKKAQVAPCVEDALAHDPHEEVVDNVGSEQEAIDCATVLVAEGQRRYRRLRGVRACSSSEI